MKRVKNTPSQCRISDEVYDQLKRFVVDPFDDTPEKVELPAWAIKEVSSDPRYFNSNLLKAPYSTWDKA